MKCGVDKNVLASMIQLIEYGVKPEHIATIVAEIKNAKKQWAENDNYALFYLVLINMYW